MSAALSGRIGHTGRVGDVVVGVAACVGYYNAVVQVLIAQGKTKRAESFLYLQGGWSRTAQYLWAAALAASSTFVLIFISVT